MRVPAASVEAPARRVLRPFASLCLPVIIGACDRIWPRQPETRLPPIETVQAMYREHGVKGDIAWNGNVLEIRVPQPAEQVRRGGSLWARVGPWVYLLSPGTQHILDENPGVAAVRVITHIGNKEVARATLRGGVLTDVLWRRTLNLLGHALRDGTRDPSRLQALAEWGEAHGEYRYNPEYVPR
jgi:hypothetical protein